MSNDANAIKAGRAYVALSADDSQLKADLDQAEKELRDYGKAAQQAGSTFYSSLTQSVKNIRRESTVSGEKALERVLGAGPEAIAGTLADALGAGAAVVGINFFSQSLKGAAENASRLREELAKGNADWGDVVETAAASVPIFGQVWQAGRAIREAFTGEKFALDAINKEAQLTAGLFDLQAEAARRVSRAVTEYRMEAQRARSDASVVGADPYTREREGITQFGREREEHRKETLDQQIQAANESAQKRFAQQQQVIESLRARFTQVNSIRSPEEEVAAFEASPNKNLWEDKQGQQAIKLARQIQAEEKRLSAMRQGAADDVNKLKAEAGAARQAAGDDDHAKLADVTRRQWEEYAKTVREGVQAASDEVNAAQVEDLRRQGKLLEAQRLQIEHESKKQRAALLQGAEDQAKALGATSWFDPRRAVIFGVAMSRIAGVDALAGARGKSAQSDEFARRAAETRELAELKTQEIDDAESREKAQIEAKYKYELDVARDAGRDLTHLTQMQAQEIANIEARYARQRKEANEEIDYQIARQQVLNTTRGLQQQLALIELERQKALQREEDPRTATGVGAEKLNALFDQESVGALLAREVHSKQFVSGLDAILSGGADNVGTDLLREIAKNTRDLVDKAATLTFGE